MSFTGFIGQIFLRLPQFRQKGRRGRRPLQMPSQKDRGSQ